MHQEENFFTLPQEQTNGIYPRSILGSPIRQQNDSFNVIGQPTQASNNAFQQPIFIYNGQNYSQNALPHYTWSPEYNNSDGIIQRQTQEQMFHNTLSLNYFDCSLPSQNCLTPRANRAQFQVSSDQNHFDQNIFTYSNNQNDNAAEKVQNLNSNEIKTYGNLNLNMPVQTLTGGNQDIKYENKQIATDIQKIDNHDANFLSQSYNQLENQSHSFIPKRKNKQLNKIIDRSQIANQNTSLKTGKKLRSLDDLQKEFEGNLRSQQEKNSDTFHIQFLSEKYKAAKSILQDKGPNNRNGPKNIGLKEYEELTNAANKFQQEREKQLNKITQDLKAHKKKFKLNIDNEMKQVFDSLKVLVNRIKRMPRNVESARNHRLKSKKITNGTNLVISELNAKIQNLTETVEKQAKVMQIYENKFQIEDKLLKGIISSELKSMIEKQMDNVNKNNSEYPQIKKQLKIQKNNKNTSSK